MSKKRKPPKYYLGLDLSLTSTGMVLANKKADRVIQQTITTLPKDRVEVRINHIWTQIEILLKSTMASKHKIKRCAIEGLAVRGAGQRTLQLAGLHYFVRIRMTQVFPKVGVVIIPPTSLKKYISGNGRCEKDKMMLSCYKRWNFEADNSDTCDAFSLTRFLSGNKKAIKKEWWI